MGEAMATSIIQDPRLSPMAGDSGHRKIQISGYGFPIGGRFGSRSGACLSVAVSAGWGREKQLPRRLRCLGLAALRSAVGLPSD